MIILTSNLIPKILSKACNHVPLKVRQKFWKNLVIDRNWKDNEMQVIYPNFRKQLRTNVTQEIVGQQQVTKKKVLIPHSAATLNILRHLHQVLKCPLELSAPEKWSRIFYQHLS